MLRVKSFAKNLKSLTNHLSRNTCCSQTDDQPKDYVDTVIIGGGIVGTSIAYHLAKEGCENVLLLEKSELTAGSTWHAAGLVAYYNVGINAKRVHYDSLSLYNRLQAETGQELGFHPCGSLRLATTPTRVDEMKYQMSRQRWNQAEQWMVDPEEIHRLHPLLNMDGIEAGLYNPGDGHIDPYSLTQALAIGAKKYGAKIQLNTEVTDVTQTERGGWRIDTADGGDIYARRVVNASGFWAKELGRKSGFDFPLIAIHHQYLVTGKVDALAELSRETPVIRDLEGSYYLRQERDGLLFGIYEAENKMKFSEDWYDDKVTPGFGKELFDADIDRIQENISMAMERVPALNSAQIRTVINGPITYTPDSLPLVGPYQGANEYWCAIGFGYGIIHAGGIGKYLAHWMQKGEPPYDLIEFDANRFSNSWTNSKYTKAKVRESYGKMNDVAYPFEERTAGRPSKRVNDLYDVLEAKGAQFGFHSGWETPNWFCKGDVKNAYQPTFRRSNWFEAVAEECRAVTNRIAIADLSSFGKICIRGDDARSFMDFLCANSVPKVGMTNISHMLTESGKVYSELTVSRLDENCFYCVTGSGSELHDLRWMEKVSRDNGFSVDIRNISDDHCVLGLAGPFSRRLMSLVAPDCDFSTQAFPFLATRWCVIGGSRARVVRLSYTGELGYEIYADRVDISNIYTTLTSIGQHMGIGDFGSYAMNSLRMEKGFRGWGSEMNLDTNPIEAGLRMFIKIKKEADFIGRSAVDTILHQAAPRVLVQFSVKCDGEVDPIGNETVWHNGKVVGNTTSGAYGHNTKQSLCFAYVPVELSNLAESSFSVEMLGKLYDATILTAPPMLIEPIRERQKKNCKLTQ